MFIGHSNTLKDIKCMNYYSTSNKEYENKIDT